jgi:hypothetical protein
VLAAALRDLPRAQRQVAAGLAVDWRLGAAPAPMGPAAPSTSAPPASLLRLPQPVMRAGAAGSGVIAEGISPKGLRWRLKARLEPGGGLCDSFEVDRDGSSEGCIGPERDVTVKVGEASGPGNVPAVPEVAVYGAVAGRAAAVHLTLKRQPRDHRSPVAGTVAVRTIGASGFQVRFLVTFIPVDTWVAAITLYDAQGGRICSQLGDDFKRRTFPGPCAAPEFSLMAGPAHPAAVMSWPIRVAVAKSLLTRFLVTAQASPRAVSPQAKLPPTPP